MRELTPLELELAKAGDARIRQRRVEQGIGTVADHARSAIRRRGRKVRCAGEDGRGPGCGYEGYARTWAGRRLKSLGCPECSGRLRPRNWPGFDAVPR